MAVRVLIVDDHAPFRALARMVLVADGFDVVGEAGDGPDALVAAHDLHPDVVLLDVQLPGTDGFAVAEELAAHRPPPPSSWCRAGRAATTATGSPRSVARGFIAKDELSGAALRLVLGEETRAP